MDIQPRLRNEKEMREMVKLRHLLQVTKILTLLPHTIMSERYLDLVLQTPVLVAETPAGTQAAPKYPESNCCTNTLSVLFREMGTNIYFGHSPHCIIHLHTLENKKP